MRRVESLSRWSHADRRSPAWYLRVLFTAFAAAACHAGPQPPNAARSSSTILATLPVDSALRLKYPATDTGLPPSVNAGVGSVPPNHTFEALYTVEFHTPQDDDSVVDWLDQIMCQLLRQRGARITTSTQYDPTLRTFHFETPTTQGWVNVSARKRRQDGSEPFVALGFEVPRPGSPLGTSLNCEALRVSTMPRRTGD